MEIQETGIAGCFVIKPRIFSDKRGYFFESFNAKVFEELTGHKGDFVQDNQSFSSYGVIRGLHAQNGEFAQAKLVRVIKGEVLDVVVDARKNSETYGKHFSVRLNEENQHQLYVPRGFLHGFAVLSETAIFSYKCDNYYKKEAEIGYRFDSPSLEIDWMIPQGDQLVSEKDMELPIF